MLRIVKVITSYYFDLNYPIHRNYTYKLIAFPSNYNASSQERIPHRDTKEKGFCNIPVLYAFYNSFTLSSQEK